MASLSGLTPWCETLGPLFSRAPNSLYILQHILRLALTVATSGPEEFLLIDTVLTWINAPIAVALLGFMSQRHC